MEIEKKWYIIYISLDDNFSNSTRRDFTSSFFATSAGVKPYKNNKNEMIRKKNNFKQNS